MSDAMALLDSLIQEQELGEQKKQDEDNYNSLARELGLQVDDGNDLTTNNPVQRAPKEDPEYVEGGLAQGIGEAWGSLGNVVSLPEQIERVSGMEGVGKAITTGSGIMGLPDTIGDLAIEMGYPEIGNTFKWRDNVTKYALERKQSLQQFAAENQGEDLVEKVIGGVAAAPGTIAAYLPYALGGPMTIVPGMAVGEVVVNADKIIEPKDVVGHAVRGVLDGLTFKFLGTVKSATKAVTGAGVYGTGSSIAWSGESEKLLSGDFGDMKWEDHIAAGVTMAGLMKGSDTFKEASVLSSKAKGVAKQYYDKKLTASSNELRHEKATAFFKEQHNELNTFHSNLDRDINTVETRLTQVEEAMGLPPESRAWMKDSAQRMHRTALAKQGMTPQQAVNDYNIVRNNPPKVKPTDYLLYSDKINKERAFVADEMRRTEENLKAFGGQTEGPARNRPVQQNADLNNLYKELILERDNLLNAGARHNKLRDGILTLEDAWNLSKKEADETGMHSDYVFAKNFPEHANRPYYELDFDVGLMKHVDEHSYAIQEMGLLPVEMDTANRMLALDTAIAKYGKQLEGVADGKNSNQLKQMIGRLEAAKQAITERAAQAAEQPSVFDAMFRVIAKEDPGRPGRPLVDRRMDDINVHEFLDQFITGKGKAKVSGNPLIDFSTKLITDSQRRSDLSAREILYQVGQTARAQKYPVLAGSRTAGDRGALTHFISNNADSNVKIMKYLFEEDRRGQLGEASGDRVTTSARRAKEEFGLTDKELNIARDLRTGIDAARDIYNNAIRRYRPDLPEMGLEDLYMMRNHTNAHTKIFVERKPKGSKKKYGENVFTYPVAHKWQIKKAMARMQKAVDKFDDGAEYSLKIQTLPPGRSKGGTAQWVEAAVDHLKATGNDYAANQLHKVYVEDQRMNLHTRGRSNTYTGGFKGDPNQAKYGIKHSNERLSSDFAEAFENYVYGITTIAERSRVESILSPMKNPDGDYAQLYPNTVKYVDTYKKNAFGEESSYTAATRDFMARRLGNNVAAQKFMQGANSYRLRIGLGNMGFIMSMPYQYLQTGHAKLVDAKVSHGHQGDITHAVGHGLTEFMNPSKESNAALTWATRQGFIDPNFIHDYNTGAGLADRPMREKALAGYTGKTRKQQAQQGLQHVFDAVTFRTPLERTESATRALSFLTNYYFMKSAGMSKDRAMREAGHFTNDVMVEYTRSEKMPLYQERFAHGTESLGGIGFANKASSMFKTFLGNWLNHAADYSVKAAKGVPKGNLSAATPLATFLAWNVMAGGLGGFVGLGLYDKIASNFTWLPSSEELLSEVNENGERYIPTMLTQGVPSTATGVDLQGTLSMPGLDPGFDFFSVPAWSLVEGAWGTAWATLHALQGDSNPAEHAAAWKKLTPRTVHGAIEAWATKRMYKSDAKEELGPDARTMQILTKYPAVTRPAGKYQSQRRTAGEWAIMFATGRRSTSEAIKVQASIAQAKMNSRLLEGRAKLVELIAVGLMRDGEVPGWVWELDENSEYNPNSLVDSGIDRAIKMNMTDEERIMFTTRDFTTTKGRSATRFMPLGRDVNQ